MNPDEIEAALLAAFNSCDTASCPLTDTQKEILLQVVKELTRLRLGLPDTIAAGSDNVNPLDELTPEQRQSLLQFVKNQEQCDRSWKVQLLNDWLLDRDSGSVQFVRDLYGPQWLNSIEPIHFDKYTEILGEEALKLKVGNRIEVANSLWEWVQETGPCSREWFDCTVISVNATNCVIRFSNGAEYEIQGVYQWNRYNWRWPSV